jgi:glycosyltransferase involved in cell wall biosynthesis
VATQVLETRPLPARTRLAPSLPVSVIVAARNEERNLPRCLESLKSAGEIFVLDSFSHDATAALARAHGARVVQFRYRGGWPKKRQWALWNLPLAHPWVLLLDADESLTPQLEAEMRRAIADPCVSGYYLKLEMRFLGRVLRHSGASFYKLALFRRDRGRFECRLAGQDESMCDMEVHEHVVVDGPTATLKHPVIHHNLESLSHYIRKHDSYSNWEARVLSARDPSHELPPALFGNQAQRRRWLKRALFRLPGSPLAIFLYRYLFRRGFLDGTPGFLYCAFQAIQMFHTKAKIYEQRIAS